jgi:hypothetical protein
MESMIPLPNIDLKYKPNQVKVDNAKQYEQFVKNYVGIQQYKKEDYEKRKKEYLDYTHLHPKDLIISKFNAEMAEEREARIHKWTKMWDESDGHLNNNQLMEIQLDQASYDAKQNNILHTVQQYEKDKEKKQSDIHGIWDDDKFNESENDLINGKLPTQFLFYKKKDPIIAANKILRENSKPTITNSAPYYDKKEGAWFKNIYSEYPENDRKLAAANSVLSPGERETVMDQMKVNALKPTDAIGMDSKGRSYQQMKDEYDNLSDEQKAIYNQTQYYAQQTLYDKIGQKELIRKELWQPRAGRKSDQPYAPGSQTTYTTTNAAGTETLSLPNVEAIQNAPKANKYFDGYAKNLNTGKMEKISGTVRVTHQQRDNGIIIFSTPSQAGYRQNQKGHIAIYDDSDKTLATELGLNAKFKNIDTGEQITLDQLNNVIDDEPNQINKYHLIKEEKVKGTTKPVEKPIYLQGTGRQKNDYAVPYKGNNVDNSDLVQGIGGEWYDDYSDTYSSAGGFDKMVEGMMESAPTAETKEMQGIEGKRKQRGEAVHQKMDKKYGKNKSETKVSSNMFQVNGKKYNIPPEKVDDFMKAFPNAQKIE